ncbi:hypothetical protein N7519_007133 [Penicillium mononematosum]|uniref:uncharacterized protein n=1 Tax=Penicillium mononematosum TaxID=268346 RepID=UPI00254961F9|nr:uncharacterized protein N7519_007133 [Penicillium mononematosum]KAJ6185832.1 hypothetical protein N7519_007133 [Penicillium mononematosum]
MPSEDNITLASNVLGTIGTVLWCIQLIPQIWYNWRRKNTEGFPAAMMFLWASWNITQKRKEEKGKKASRLKLGLLTIVIHAGSVPMGAYLILQQVNIPLQIQPQIFGFFSLVSWSQVLYYNHNYSKTKAVLVCSGTVVLFGGLEALLILTLRIPYNDGVTWPDIVVGVIAAILLTAGLLPPYFELWKRDGRVIGFNWGFLAIDTMGGLFSLFALGMSCSTWKSMTRSSPIYIIAAQGSFDILGGDYAGIYISHLSWRIRYRKLLKEAKDSGKSIDDLLLLRNNMQETGDIEKGILAASTAASPSA